MKKKLIFPIVLCLIMFAASASSYVTPSAPMAKAFREENFAKGQFYNSPHQAFTIIFIGRVTYDAGLNRFLVIDVWQNLDNGDYMTGMQPIINGSEGACLYDGSISVSASGITFSGVTIDYFSGAGNGSFAVADGFYSY